MAAALGGCRTAGVLDALARALPYQRALETPEGKFQIDLPTPTPSVEAMMVSAVVNASPALAQWGRLERPVTLFVVPDHAALEAVIPARFDGLRAWAEADHIVFQSPQSWSQSGANLRQVTETLTHELTHALMFQLAGADTPERQAQFPLWFREGMALSTARQEATVPTLESLARYLLSRPATDPLRDEAHVYDSPGAFDMAYGAGLHAFEFLLERYGPTSVRTLLNAMRSGASFDAAFTAAMGISPAAFLNDFETFVRLRGFAQGRALRAPARKR
jgi:hypothetical protein